MKKEESLAHQISQYLQLKHTRVIFRFDYGADVKLTMYQAKKMKALQGKWSKGYPDLFIAEPKGVYSGLFIELKAVSPYKKNGELKKSEHLETQAHYHKLLRRKGYCAEFSTGFKETVELIEKYMKC